MIGILSLIEDITNDYSNIMIISIRRYIMIWLFAIFGSWNGDGSFACTPNIKIAGMQTDVHSRTICIYKYWSIAQGFSLKIRYLKIRFMIRLLSKAQYPIFRHSQVIEMYEQIQLKLEKIGLSQQKMGYNSPKKKMVGCWRIHFSYFLKGTM